MFSLIHVSFLLSADFFNLTMNVYKINGPKNEVEFPLPPPYDMFKVVLKVHEF